MVTIFLQSATQLCAPRNMHDWSVLRRVAEIIEPDPTTDCGTASSPAVDTIDTIDKAVGVLLHPVDRGDGTEGHMRLVTYALFGR